jgi:hypothetical protein
MVKSIVNFTNKLSQIKYHSISTWPVKPGLAGLKPGLVCFYWVKSSMERKFVCIFFTMSMTGIE